MFYSIILYLYFYCGLNTPEIANILSCKEQVIKRDLNKEVTVIKELLNLEENNYSEIIYSIIKKDIEVNGIDKEQSKRIYHKILNSIQNERN